MPTTKPRPPKSPDLYGFGEGAEMDEAIFEAMPDDGALPDRPMMGLSAEPIIQMRGVYKFFGDLLALNNVSLDIMAGEKVVIVDDLIATGGTVGATVKLVKQLGADLLECAFVVELPDLKGRDQIPGCPVFSITEFGGE